MKHLRLPLLGLLLAVAACGDAVGDDARSRQVLWVDMESSGAFGPRSTIRAAQSI